MTTKKNKNKKKKGFKSKDPHFAREQNKYERPIASREYIAETIERFDGPVGQKVLMKELNIRGAEQVGALKRRLKAMVRDGQLAFTRDGYVTSETLDCAIGIVKIQPSGSARVEIEHEQFRSVFLSNKDSYNLWSGDTVEVKITSFDGTRAQGVVHKILKTATPTLIGEVHKGREGMFVLPLHTHVKRPVEIESEISLKSGDEVKVRLRRDKHQRVLLEGVVLEKSAQPSERNTAIDIAITEYDLPTEFSEKALNQAAKHGSTIPNEWEEDRVDCRELCFVTIDGEDARDFDDAIYLEKTKGGFTLFVAIADVSYYVEEDSILDKEARERGNSVYFPTKVLPMLPEALSNGLCSLNPHVERFAMVAEMHLNAKGQVKHAEFYPGVIKSKARLTYTIVAAALDGDPKARKEVDAVYPMLEDLSDLYQIMAKSRHKRGALDFDSVEARFIFDEEGQIEDVTAVQRNRAHRIVEECMLLANVSVAKFLNKHKQPCLYRNHEGPSEEKLSLLKEFLTSRGMKLGGGMDPKPSDYSQVLQDAEGRPDKQDIQMALLRSFNQAVYGPDCEGHFGLAYDKYLHFTSPIRRYPDLVVHRALVDLVRGENWQDDDNWIHSLDALGQHCSMTERRADDATRDVAMALKCAWAANHVGEQFNGRISGVTNFGLFVTVDELYLDGLVHITSLDDDYYELNANACQLIGQRAGKVYNMGDKVRIQIVSVDEIEKKIDFELVEDDE